MIRTITVCAFFSVALSCGSAFGIVAFDWATVGNPGNAADDTGFGAVDYTYRISKHEVTNAQYVEFLNAVAATDPNQLYHTDMGNFPSGGITRSGSPGSYSYSVKPDVIGQGPGGADGEDYAYGNKPVVFVSFFDVMRFVNWLENGQPTGAQAPGTTEDGVYTISDGVSEVRSPDATFFIPREDEWYKAAYYSPSGVYYDYPTSTDSAPNNNLPSGDTGNSANYERATGSFELPMTDVGAYALSDSPYGTFDQGGNVGEWNEDAIESSFRALRGGSWQNTSVTLLATFRIKGIFAAYGPNTGFRVASIIPEPRTMLLGALASVAALLLRRRDKCPRNPACGVPSLRPRFLAPNGAS